MALIYLVRHAQPASGVDDLVDPGLDELGAAQALDAAANIAGLTATLPIYSSPMRRCRETAAPLAARWRRAALLLDAVAELPAPDVPPQARAAWLRQVLQGSWGDLAQHKSSVAMDLPGWRHRLLIALSRLEADSVVFTHYVAINAAVGAARGSDAVQVFRPAHASLTLLRFEASQPLNPQLLQLGKESPATPAAAPLPGRHSMS